MIWHIMMVTSSQQPTETMYGGATVLRRTAGVGGGITIAVPGPILMVCTTTHPGPQIELGCGWTIGMVLYIPSKQQL